MSDIYLSLTETPSVVTLSQPVIASAVAATVTVGNTVTVALDANSLSALENVTVTVGSSVALAAGSAQVGSVSISNFPATQVVSVSNLPATQPVSLATLPNSTVTVANFPASQTVAGTVTVGNFPATQTIAGTVTANLPQAGAWAGIYDSGNDCIKIELANLNGDTLSPGNPLPISGTVTANVQFSASLSGVDVPAPMQGIALGYLTDSETFFRPVHEDQGLPVRIQGQSATQPISGTVTANNPSGALTTRFGSVATANLAFITSAVTNTSRKYLLAQNISEGTVTIGIGFSPTTTQGVQLPAGGGLTFDAFCPTGAVYWLGAVTGAAYTILEG